MKIPYCLFGKPDEEKAPPVPASGEKAPLSHEDAVPSSAPPESGERKNEKKPLSRKNRNRIAALGAVILAALLVLGGSIVRLTEKNDPEKPVAAFDGDLLTLKDQAARLKSDLKLVLDDLTAQNTADAALHIADVRQDTVNLRAVLARPIWRLAENLPLVGRELQNAEKLVELVEEAVDTVLTPLLKQMEAVPLSTLTVEDGFNVGIINDYLDFLPSIVPAVDDLSRDLAGIDLKLADPEGKLDGYRDKLTSLLTAYHEMEPCIPLLKAILGSGGDRFYVFAAQNSAEIRSSGGFPGAMGSLAISDGILTIGDFVTVYEVLTDLTPDMSWMTYEERVIFTDKLAVPRDADYCPDFERVGKVWAMSYEQRMFRHVDGVISMTPAVVQKLLSFLGEITLSDGTVLNGENATRVLQHELYYDYLARDGAKFSGGNYDMLDAFWVESARAVMHLVTESFSPGLLTNYLAVLQEGTADRTIMFWMADPEEQALVRSLGWSGGLNSDPTRPEAGIYYSCADASKLGWYVGMEAQCGEPRQNADGSMTYGITLTLINNMDDNTRSMATWYVLGSHYGSILTDLQLYAPAGGSIANVENSYGVYFNYGTDGGLELSYSNEFLVHPHEPMVITYEVTTSPLAEEPLRFSMTPTLQEYW